jgi:hypothetical protein
VRSLELNRDFFGVAGWTALVGSPFLSSLEVLDVNCGEVGSEGARALVSSPARKSLMHLSLRYVHLGDEGLAELLAVDFPRLTRLALPFNELGPRSAQLLLESRWAARLEHLDLSENEALDPASVRRLRQRFGARLAA